MADAAPPVPREWQRLSRWSIVHFTGKTVVQNLQGLLFFGGPAAFGASQWTDEFPWWVVPAGIIIVVLIGGFVTHAFYTYRVLDDTVQVRRGALFKQHLDLPFERIQNVSLEHPFYFRPLGRVTLRIDGGGATGEEVNLPALELPQAERARDHIVRRKHQLGPAAAERRTSRPGPPTHERAEAFFTRSLFDLVVHGLTNNRSFIAIAGLFAFLWQTNVSPADAIGRLDIDVDLVIADMSLVGLALLFVVSLLVVLALIAALSVLVAVVTYYGFSMYHTADGLTVTRGLLTRHEIHVKKSRIQTVTIRQDWLDRLLGRRNVLLERISHSRGHDETWTAQKRILVPSVREAETATVTDEILPGCRIDDLPFTPIAIRYFYKHAAIACGTYITALAAAPWLPDALGWLAVAIGIAWPLHVLHLFLSWRRGGLAVDGDYIVVRSGTIGIEYRIFPADKAQDITHVQSVLMQRHNVSSLMFHTASTTITVPYMDTDFMKAVVDYCAYRVESTHRSWM